MSKWVVDLLVDDTFDTITTESEDFHLGTIREADNYYGLLETSEKEK